MEEGYPLIPESRPANSHGVCLFQTEDLTSPDVVWCNLRIFLHKPGVMPQSLVLDADVVE